MFSWPDCLNTLKKVLPKPTLVLKGLFQRYVYQRWKNVKCPSFVRHDAVSAPGVTFDVAGGLNLEEVRSKRKEAR